LSSGQLLNSLIEPEGLSLGKATAFANWMPGFSIAAADPPSRAQIGLGLRHRHTRLEAAQNVRHLDPCDDLTPAGNDGHLDVGTTQQEMVEHDSDDGSRGAVRRKMAADHAGAAHEVGAARIDRPEPRPVPRRLPHQRES
jgi:hypothetical protein